MGGVASQVGCRFCVVVVGTEPPLPFVVSVDTAGACTKLHVPSDTFEDTTCVGTKLLVSPAALADTTDADTELPVPLVAPADIAGAGTELTVPSAIPADTADADTKLRVPPPHPQTLLELTQQRSPRPKKMHILDCARWSMTLHNA